MPLRDRLRPASAVETELVLDVPGARGAVTERVVPLADVVRGEVQVELKRALEADLPELDGSADETTDHDEEA